MVFENSRVTCPSHPGSKGVTFTIIPHLAYVDFPRHITRTFSGILPDSIKQGQYTKMSTLDGRLLVINDNNVLCIEVFEEID